MNIVKIHFSRSENVTELSKFLCLNLGNFRNKGDQKRNSALPFKFSGVSEHAKNMQKNIHRQVSGKGVSLIKKREDGAWCEREQIEGSKG